MKDIGKSIPYRFRGRNLQHNEKYIQIGLEEDNGVNTITFILDRYYQGIDLNDFDVQLLLTGSFMPEPQADILTVENGLVKEVDRATITLKWTVTINHTSQKGVGAGQFRFISASEEVWSTDVFGLMVGNSLEVDEVIEALFPSIISNHTARISAFEEALGNIYTKSEINALLNDKVDKIAGKELSTNDFTNELKTAYNNAVSLAHEHGNKTTLDEISNAVKERYDEAADKMHSHSNKYVIDQITEQTKSEYDDAVEKKHSHINKDVLDATEAVYTQAEKEKLAGLESSHFKGKYISYEALVAAHPTGNAGDYAHVDEGAGKLVKLYIWDTNDNLWVNPQGATADLTPSEVKALYEANPDTNAYTNAEKNKVANALVTTSDIKDTVTTFTEAGTRANIATGEKTSTIFGKIKKWFTDLKAHAFNDLATAQGTEEDKAPTNKLLRESTCAAFYRSLTEINPTFDDYTDMVTVIDAMEINSIASYNVEADDSTVYPSADLQVHIFKTKTNRVTCFAYRKVWDNRLQYFWVGGFGGSTGNPLRWAGWRRVFTSDDISTVMPASLDAASDSKVASEKLLRGSSFNAVYRTLTEIDPTFTIHTDMNTVITAMADNSIASYDVTGSSAVYPDIDLQVHIFKLYNSRVTCFAYRKVYNSDRQYFYVGGLGGAVGSTYRWAGWRKVFTSDDISTVMPISSDAAKNEKVLSEKVVYDELANRTYSRIYTSLASLGITTSSTMVDAATAMLNNGVATISVTSAYTNILPPNAYNGVALIKIERLTDLRILCTASIKETNTYNSQMWFGFIKLTDTINQWSGWKQLATTDSPTFTGTVTVPDATVSGAAVNKGQMDAALALKANDNAVVKTSGNQTIAGVKTFASSPIVPNATADNEAVNKGYVDSRVIKQPNKSYVLYHATAGTNNLYLSAATYSHTYASAGAYLITISGTGSSATVNWGDGTSGTVDFTGGFKINIQADKYKYIEVHLGTNCAFIGNNAFRGCSGLTSVTIPNSVTSIGNFAFDGCSGLTSITIGNSVPRIGDYAFRGCSGLTSITIPDSVTSIGDYAFDGCSGLTSITIPNSVTSIGNSAFYSCYSLTSITIPNSVTSIGNSAFYGCYSLTSITIPNSVTSIGNSAFAYCRSLTSINFMGNSIPTIGSNAFVGCRIADIIAQTSALADSAATAITTAGGTLLTNYRKLY